MDYTLLLQDIVGWQGRPSTIVLGARGTLPTLGIEGRKGKEEVRKKKKREKERG